MNATDSYIEIAKIVKPQGIKGELKLLPFSRDARDLSRYQNFHIAGDGGSLSQFEVERFRVAGQYAILKLVGVNDRSQAEEYRDCSVLIEKNQLPETVPGEYLIRTLIGLQVVTEGGEPLGTLTDVFELPANDVYQIQYGQRELLIPAISDVILDIQLDKRIMIVRLLDGLLDLAE